MSLALRLYRLATHLTEPLAPLVLRSRARRGKEDAARVAERLGRATRPRPAGPLIWLHGVSVGETQSLLPLVSALCAARPAATLLVTSGTVTSAQALSQRLPAEVIHQYVPIDTPTAIARFLDHWRPDLAIFAESELWPNLILAAKAQGARLALVSARMTTASAEGWGRVPAAARVVLGAFDLVMAQDEASRARLTTLGAACGPGLNLKLTGEPLPADEAELARLKSVTGLRKVVLAASTHPGEDDLIVQAFQAAVPDPAEALLILVPRHPDRGPDLAKAFQASLRSAGGSPTGPIHIADTLGELGLFFRLADIVVMGGGFVPGIGGHNPLEPARIGRPILTGPHTFNAAEVYADLFAYAAAIQAKDAPDLTRHLRGLLDNPAIARRMGEAALGYAERQAAGLGAALVALEPLLPA